MSSLPSSTPFSLPQDSRQSVRREQLRRDPALFITECCWIDTEPEWEKFILWPAQSATLEDFRRHARVAVLKARQLGLTWLALAYALHLMLFVPGTTVLFFSKGEREARELLRRLKGMVERLPAWLRPETDAPTNTEELTLGNGSNAKVFPTTGGRSYTGSLVVVDEADWIDTFPELLRAVKPTVDAGGKLILLSSPDKGKPESLFKAIYRAAREGANGYHPIFLPWSARPSRTQDWYDAEKVNDLATKGTLDDIYQEYPETEAQALSPRELDKRIPPCGSSSATAPCKHPPRWGWPLPSRNRRLSPA